MTCFREIGSECGIETDLEFDSPFMAIGAVADVIRADRDMLMLDIGTFAKDYPDASEAQALALLAVGLKSPYVLIFIDLQSFHELT